MPPKKDSLGRPLSSFASFGPFEALGPHEPTDLRVARARQLELSRKRTHTSIDLGQRLARIIEDSERREQPTIDPRC